MQSLPTTVSPFDFSNSSHPSPPYRELKLSDLFILFLVYHLPNPLCPLTSRVCGLVKGLTFYLSGSVLLIFLFLLPGQGYTFNNHCVFVKGMEFRLGVCVCGEGVGGWVMVASKKER